VDELEVGLAMRTMHARLIGQSRTEFLAEQRTRGKAYHFRAEDL
jgi:hypothetical protein